MQKQIQVYLYIMFESSRKSLSQIFFYGRQVAFLSLILCFLSGCALIEPEKEAPKEINPTGVTGKVSPEAEQAYAKARVLWGAKELCSDPEKAMQYLDEALKIEPDYAQALLRKGLLLSEEGNNDEAFELITRAIRLEPSAEAYTFRGLCLLRQGNSSGATHDLNEAIRLAPQQYRAYNYRGTVFLHDGDLKAACLDFKQACSLGDCSFLEKATQENFCK